MRTVKLDLPCFHHFKSLALLLLLICLLTACLPRPEPTAILLSTATNISPQPTTSTISSPTRTATPSPSATSTRTPTTNPTWTSLPIILPTKTPAYETYHPISVENARSAQIVYGFISSSRSGEVYDLGFSPLGGLLAVANELGDLQMWRFPSEETRISIQDYQIDVFQGSGDGINAVAFSPDGKNIASGGTYAPLLIRDPVTGKNLSRPITNIDHVSDIVYSPDGSLLAISGHKSDDNKYSIQLWRVSDNQLIVTLDDFPRWWGAICSLAISSDGILLAAGFCDYHMMVWDLKNEYKSLGNVIGQYAFECYSHCPLPTNSIAFMPNSTILASGTDNAGIPLIDIYTGRLSLQMDTGRLAEWIDPTTGNIIRAVSAPDVADIAFSPDGTLLAIAAGHEIQLRSTETNELLTFFETPEETYVTAISFSPDGLLIAAGSNYGNIYIIGVKD